MRIVVALGGNALLERKEVPDAEIQEAHVHRAVAALGPIATTHELVITHGNGPQVGVLAAESASDSTLSHPYPLDVVGAQTQGMIGYWLMQSFENVLPGRIVASLVCQTLVDPDDPAFSDPVKFVGPIYDEATARRIAGARDWVVHQDGAGWRRVVASPKPKGLVEFEAIRMLLERGALVICAGGGGIPVARSSDGLLYGVEAVIDKDMTAALLAELVGADLLMVLTDVAAVEVDFGTPSARPIGEISVKALRAMSFPAGSMGPKIEAVCSFVDATGRRAVIGRLEDAGLLLAGRAGTIVERT